MARRRGDYRLVAWSHTALTVRCEGGAIATFSAVGSAKLNWREDVFVHGTKGCVLYRDERLSVAKGLNGPVLEVPETELPASSDLDANFTDLILGRITTPAAPAVCGYRVARLTEAAWQSTASGQWFCSPNDMDLALRVRSYARVSLTRCD
ncbi:hypothetical protein [Alicyclobacillus fastidiosus]|uniref:Uncharacterized protein n=1 Tax=Alicyclobacillus fastidiosus TaxID=392011 RepID=A0ABV5AD26_9BACL|nr:hypothetical protein [Alicyclobacillus fastidiosus]WEH10483.1 hypothetical protein PYS47_04445 [Alicyclobacillus fastidiosus]